MQHSNGKGRLLSDMASSATLKTYTLQFGSMVLQQEFSSDKEAIAFAEHNRMPQHRVITIIRNDGTHITSSAWFYLNEFVTWDDWD